MTQANVQRYVRLGGLLYLLNILAGLFGEVFVRGRLVVAGDAAATAHNILAHEFLFRCGIAGDLFMHVTDVPTIVIFYLLLRPVSADLSLLAAFFNLVQTSMLVANKVQLVATLDFLRTPSQAFTTGQLQQLAMTSLDLHEQGFGVGLVFFGVTCVLTGYLIWRSGFLPRAIGGLQVMVGICYLVNSFMLILVPVIAARLAPVLLTPAGLGELITCLWLLFMGVNVTRWEERVRRGPVMVSMVD